MNKIFIYSDEGVDGGSLKHLNRSLKEEIDPSQCSIYRIDAKGLIEQSWEKEANLLIVPGGRDIYYHDKLHGAGTDKIRNYVYSGGNYLGICAGAYFAASDFEFEKGGQFEVCASRSLKFFPGKAIGSAYGLNKYSYENAKGVEAARISSEVGECSIYFNGGCFFETPEHFPTVKTIGRYLDLPGEPSAILQIQVGDGLAILSGVHLEYAPRQLNRQDFFLSAILPALDEGDLLRRALFRSYLSRLGIPLRLNKSNDKSPLIF